MVEIQSFTSLAYLSREARFSATVIGGVVKKLRLISRGIVLESFKVNFFSTANVSDGTGADDDSVDDVLVSGTPDPSSVEDEPLNRPFSLPTSQIESN
jgi:hypothetical protein